MLYIWIILHCFLLPLIYTFLLIVYVVIDIVDIITFVECFTTSVTNASFTFTASAVYLHRSLGL